MSALTVLAPIVEGREDRLTRHLDGLPGGDGSPLARVAGTHFARWVVIPDVVQQGDGQCADHLKSSRLLFASSFDGPLASYLEALRTGLGADADTIWGHCLGYPGRREPEAFAGWLCAHRIVDTLAYAAHDQTVGEVHSNLELRARLIDFALGCQGLAPELLMSGFRERFPAVTRLDLDDIQGFVVRGYRLPVAAHVFLRVDEAARGRALLADLLPRVVSAAPWEEKPAAAINVALTYNGLAALNVPEPSLYAFPPEFVAGMAARADLIGDAGESAPEHWEPCFHRTDLLVLVSARDADALAEQTARIRGAARTSGGATVVGEQAGTALAGGSEHFGFVAAGAQPELEGSGLPARPGRGAPRRGGRWRPIRAGEFLLGYPDEEDLLPPAPPPDQLSRNGTFLVYRKLRQHVGEFRRRVAAADHPGGAELVAAKVVGRWRDGTPLDTSPERPDPALAADPARVGAFSYAGDEDGLRCPVGAHARRANPRLGLPFDGRLVNRHRLIRRSIPYGEPLPTAAPDDGHDRGLLFMCLQASIARQFEFVQSHWLGDGDAFGLGRDSDPIAGGISTKLTIPGQPPLLLGPLPPLVTVRGGEYFFVPGLTGLRHIARVR